MPSANGPSKGIVYPITLQAQVVILKHFTAMSNDEIATLTGVSARQIQQFNKTAKERGFDGTQPFQDAFVVDGYRAPRKLKINEEAIEAI